MMNDPIAMLTTDHRDVEHLLAQLGKAETSERPGLLDQLDSSLRLHMEIEEGLLYPIVAKQIGKEEAKEAEVEHGLAREGLGKLRELVDQPGFGAAVDMLKGGIDHHVHEEEGELFPQLTERLDESERSTLGDRIAEAKGAVGVPGAAVSSDATKAELMDEAKARDIPGRSNMTKDELLEALREQ
jgi:iron-sulfur cluster repair protein YtfE (RIC family)